MFIPPITERILLAPVSDYLKIDTRTITTTSTTTTLPYAKTHNHGVLGSASQALDCVQEKFLRRKRGWDDCISQRATETIDIQFRAYQGEMALSLGKDGNEKMISEDLCCMGEAGNDVEIDP